VAKLGYRFEGIAGYIYPTQQSGAAPLYRAYRAIGNDHFYTVN
jgi:hypothetical protein